MGTGDGRGVMEGRGEGNRVGEGDGLGVGATLCEGSSDGAGVGACVGPAANRTSSIAMSPLGPVPVVPTKRTVVAELSRWTEALFHSSPWFPDMVNNVVHVAPLLKDALKSSVPISEPYIW